MEKPPLKDELLGTLTWDDTLDYWTGEAVMAGIGPVRISVDTEDEEITPAEALANTHGTYLILRNREPEVRDFAAAALLETHNQAWSQGEAIDEVAFAEQLSLEDISFHPDGSAELFYNAGELFGGHTVIVTVDEDGAFDDAQIAG